METGIMNGMCRCCASEGVFKDIKTSYSWMGEEEVYADMLRECFDVSLSVSEQGADGGICEVCITQLRNASNFKKQVQHTEVQFKKHAQNKLFRPNIVKVEMAPDDDDSDDNNMSPDESFSGPEYEVPIKTESDEPKPKKRAAATKASTSRAKKAKIDPGESSSKRGHKAVTLKGKTEENVAGRADIKDNPTSKDKTDTANKGVHKSSKLTKHRSNIKEIMLWSNATPIRRYADMGYMCCFCYKQYLEPGDLKNHTIDLHHDITKACFMTGGSLDQFVIKLDITSLRCKICEQNIETLPQLMEHLVIKHQKNIHTDIKNHMIPFKFHSETLQCCICTSTFTKFKMLLEHMNLHCRNFICDVCDAGYVNHQSIKMHKLTHETGTFHCEHCPKIFDTNVKRKSHERIMHSLKPLFRCDNCNETFNYYRQKEIHLVSMHGLKLPTPKCEACGKDFNTRVLLNRHIKRDHLMDRQHKCSECDMSFFLSNDLKDHMVKHSGIKSFKCTVCIKAFSRAKSLKEHMKIHDDVRRFKCAHCGRTFVQKCSWRGHMRSKHEEIV